MKSNRIRSRTQQGRVSQLAIRLAPVSLAFALVLPSFSPESLQGHDSLYQYLEVSQDSAGRRTLAISIHLADFASEFGIDSNRSDLAWWSKLDPRDQDRVRREAGDFLHSSFLFSDPLFAKSLAASLLGAEINDENEPARPGCVLVIAEIPPRLEKLEWVYQSDQKRLMVILTRPGQFPQVLDRAAGERVILPLPVTTP
ncbi:MAG: hypothetical protein P1U85_14575 [Verrucomicrobiales bacterium]|nr:hypothetical protein [Verrucomicrobiales bacterium]